VRWRIGKREKRGREERREEGAMENGEKRKEKRKKERENYLATTDYTFILIVAKGAFVADAYEGCWAHVTVAYGAFAVAFVAETADGYAGGLAAHDQIAVVCLLVRCMFSS
jgi:hypothetical protein